MMFSIRTRDELERNREKQSLASKYILSTKNTGILNLCLWNIEYFSKIANMIVLIILVSILDQLEVKNNTMKIHEHDYELNRRENSTKKSYDTNHRHAHLPMERNITN